MTEDQRELAKRLSAHSKWRWQAGMKGLQPIVRGGNAGMAVQVEILESAHKVERWGPGWMRVSPEAVPEGVLPDLEHPGTEGWLLRILASQVSRLDFYANSAKFWDLDWEIEGDDQATGCAVGASFGGCLALCLLDAWGEP